MKTTQAFDAVVVGAGPNGLTAAVVLAQAGLSVVVLEGNTEPGGGCRTMELTLPRFYHDVCAAIHPMGSASPAFRRIGLFNHCVEWITAPIPLAHPLPNGEVALLDRSLDATCDLLRQDGSAWRRTIGLFANRAGDLFDDILRPIRWPHHPVLALRFALTSLQSCESFVARFSGQKARALLGGCAAHSFLPLDAPASAAFGVVLATAAHAADWPCVKGGSQQLISALANLVLGARGEIRTGVSVRTMKDIPSSRVVLFDLTARQIACIARDHLPAGYVRKLERYQYGPGVFKVDWALNAPIPWRNPECSRAATVHVAGSFAEIAASQHSVAHGATPERPFVLVAQQSLFDKTRAPAGKQTGWAYCHVPNGSNEDMTNRIEDQIERFAPGFRDTILARHVMNCADFEAHNPNLIGGDIGGGANNLKQFVFRPVLRWNPYSTPNPRLFICSSSTPPGGGVHGMCGYWAAQAALKRSFGQAHLPF